MLDVHTSGWYQLLAELTPKTGQPDFFGALSDALGQIIHIDCTGVIFYDGTEVTNVFEGNLSPEYSEYLKQYLQGMYLLDPHYSFLSNGVETGIYRFRDIAPDCFHESKYYESFVKPVGITDEFDFIININNRYLDFYLNRLGGEFSAADKAALTAIAPMICYLIETHWQNQEKTSRQSAQSTYTPHYHSFFDSFGKSILTSREQEVVKCILHGHSSKSLADKLNSSLSTVKIHRKNIYQKLDIKTQSELFSLCIQSLSLSEFSEFEDPLSILKSKRIPQ